MRATLANKERKQEQKCACKQRLFATPSTDKENSWILFSSAE